MGVLEDLEGRIEAVEKSLVSVVSTLRDQCLTTGPGVNIHELAQELGRRGYTVSYVERTESGLKTIPKIVVITPKKVTFDVYSSTMHGLLAAFEAFISRENEFDWVDWLFRPITTKVGFDGTGQEGTTPGEQESIDEGQIPPVLPILPLRGLVVYPQTVVPLTIGQARSIRLVDDVMAADERFIGLVASRNPDLEMPGPNDLFAWGTVAVVHRLFRAPDGTIRLVVQGLARFRLGDFLQEEPFLKAHIHMEPEVVEEGLEVEALARNTRDQFEHIAEMIPSIPREHEAKGRVNHPSPSVSIFSF